MAVGRFAGDHEPFALFKDTGYDVIDMMKPRKKEIEKYKPGVPKSTLLLVGGLLWILIGIMLDSLAYSWLRIERHDHALWAAVIGFGASLVIHHFGFLRIVDRNLNRILPMQGRRCVFSFMPWKSYILVAVMIALGFFLRHSPLPKLYLAAVYIGIGTALILSSIRYLRYVVLTLKK